MASARRELDPATVKSFDLKFDAGDMECKNCRFDHEMNGNTPSYSGSFHGQSSISGAPHTGGKSVIDKVI